MDDYSSKRVRIYDEGQFVGLAQRLARDFGSVEYFMPSVKSAPTFTRRVIGDGLPGVKRIFNFWDDKDSVDLFVFTDCYGGDIQEELERQGRRVWGSRRADRFEWGRELFKKKLKAVGLPVNPYKVVKGITALREHLMEHDDQIVKLTFCRGDSETFDCPSYELRKSKIDSLEYYYGPFAEEVEFLCEDKIKTEAEVGYDGICIDGQFTDGFTDYEIKNEACLIAVRKYPDEFAEPVLRVNEAFSPLLAKERYRSPFGTEIRLDDEGTPFFIDATCRNASPPGETLWEMVTNLAEVMYHGAHGEFVQALYEEPFACQIMLYLDREDTPWTELEVPKSVERWIKLSTPTKVNGLYYPVPHEGYEHLPWSSEIVGAAIGMGGTAQKAIDNAIEHAGEVQGFKLHYSVDAIREAVEAASEGQEQGIEFGKLPDPETVTAD